MPKQKTEGRPSVKDVEIPCKLIEYAYSLDIRVSITLSTCVDYCERACSHDI
jgi:hypothetical protein